MGQMGGAVQKSEKQARVKCQDADIMDQFGGSVLGVGA